LHEVRSVQAEDGSIVHHHTYKGAKEDDHTEPERMNVATSSSPEDAGSHVADQFGMNGGGQAGAGEPDGDEAAQGGQADPGAAAMA
jgi:hypothetical protein